MHACIRWAKTAAPGQQQRRARRVFLVLVPSPVMYFPLLRLQRVFMGLFIRILLAPCLWYSIPLLSCLKHLLLGLFPPRNVSAACPFALPTRLTLFLFAACPLGLSCVQRLPPLLGSKHVFLMLVAQLPQCPFLFAACLFGAPHCSPRVQLALVTNLVCSVSCRSALQPPLVCSVSWRCLPSSRLHCLLCEDAFS